MSNKTLKRNDVVIPHKGGMYGRVNRILSDGRIEWICCGKHINVNHPHELEKSDYDGYGKWVECRSKSHRDENGYPVRFFQRDENGFIFYDYAPSKNFWRWYSMPTLRKLKQRASYYKGKAIWGRAKRNVEVDDD